MRKEGSYVTGGACTLTLTTEMSGSDRLLCRYRSNGGCRENFGKEAAVSSYQGAEEGMAGIFR